MSVTTLKYAASAAIAITLNGLADAAARESTAIDNSANDYVDVLVSLAIPVVAGSPGNFQAINVFAYGSEDGTNYGDNATGTDAALTLRAGNNLRSIGSIQVGAAGALTWKSHPMSISRAFGGVMPRKWGIVVDNECGLAFAGAACTATFTGVSTQSV